MAIELFPYDPFAERIWALRDNVTVYDAWYIAVAESLGAPLATLDLTLGWAPARAVPSRRHRVDSPISGVNGHPARDLGGDVPGIRVQVLRGQGRAARVAQAAT